MLFLEKIELAKKETIKFLRQQGQNLQTLSDTGEIFQQLNHKLSQLNLSEVMTRETIDVMLAQVIAENYSIEDTVIIDPFTFTEFGNYIKKKNYDTPDKILRGNIKYLEGIRALEDDIDFLEQNCNGFVPITEDEEMVVQSESVLRSIHDAQVREELPVNLEEHLDTFLENGLEMLDDLLDEAFSEMERSRWGTNQMA